MPVPEITSAGVGNNLMFYSKYSNIEFQRAILSFENRTPLILRKKDFQGDLWEIMPFVTN